MILEKKTDKTRVSIVIPVYNGEKTIAPLTDLLVENLAALYDLEIVLVNDCSPDDSERVCIACHRKYPAIVKFYSLAKNVGEHNAVMAGLNKSRGAYVVIMDDDFQNPVGEVVNMVAYARQNSFDVVYSVYEKKMHSLFRNLASAFNDSVATIMLKKPKDLYLSSFKVLNRFIVDEIIGYNMPYPYIDGLILRTTSNIGTLKVEHQRRREGSSGYTLKKLLTLWMNMFTNFSILPLRIAMLAGFICAIAGFGIGLDALIEKFTNPDLPIGYSLVLFSITFFAGIQLIAIGMVGEYLGRMFLSHNKQPQYSIRRSFEPSTRSAILNENVGANKRRIDAIIGQ
ncbi:MAG: glycosyltransferase family 2 protein [Chitinivibrionales bacterium]|nr:glycosyltransferase family 2 protein [Chitinivibrionales bacterium]